jgi:hydrogenase maturation protease
LHNLQLKYHMSALTILVVGLGNPILGDDGVGWRIAEAVKHHVKNPTIKDARSQEKIDFDTISLGGIGLMERIVDYNYAIIIDAIHTGTKPLGSVLQFTLEELPDSLQSHTGSAHDMNLTTAIELGARMGLNLPSKIYIVGIEAENVYDFSEELSPPIKKAIPAATKVVTDLIKELETNR